MQYGQPGQLLVAPKCPKCEAELDGFGGVGNDSHPEPDSITICAYCQALLIFTERMDLRAMTEREYCQLPWQVQQELNEAMRFTSAMALSKKLKEQGRSELEIKAAVMELLNPKAKYRSVWDDEPTDPAYAH